MIRKSYLVCFICLPLIGMKPESFKVDASKTSEVSVNFGRIAAVGGAVVVLGGLAYYAYGCKNIRTESDDFEPDNIPSRAPSGNTGKLSSSQFGCVQQSDN